MSQWREKSLGEFVGLQRGHDLTDGERQPGNVPVMGSAGMNGYHAIAKAKGPGVVVGRSGASFGQVHYCPTDYWPHNTALYVTDFRGNDTRFTYYFLKSIDFSRYNSGSAQASLNRNFIYPIRICIPEPREQRAIASVLGALDDKIELNRRMNETLEALAQSLFKSWFVDATQSALPKGWREGRLDEVLVLQRGFDLPSTQRTPGTYPVICASGPNGTHGEFRVRGPGVTTGRSGTLGQVYFVHEDFWPHNTSLWVKEFKHSTPLFAFLLLRTLDFGIFNSGSAVPTLNRNHVHNLPVNIPPIELIQEFEATVSLMYQRLKSNDEESRTLAALRDALLPKLLSGEIRLNNKARMDYIPENESGL